MCCSYFVFVIVFCHPHAPCMSQQAANSSSNHHDKAKVQINLFNDDLEEGKTAVSSLYVNTK